MPDGILVKLPKGYYGANIGFEIDASLFKNCKTNEEATKMMYSYEDN